MIGGAISVGAGAGLGGLLGQAGEVLSTPRRTLWSMLGLPETGSALMSEHLGMDPTSPLTSALGLGAEVLGDPLTYAGALAGPLARLGTRGLMGAGAAREALLASGAGEVGEALSKEPQVLGRFAMKGGVPDIPLPTEGYSPARTFDTRLVMEDPYAHGVKGITSSWEHPAIGTNPLDTLHGSFEAQAAQGAAQEAFVAEQAAADRAIAAQQAQWRQGGTPAALDPYQDLQHHHGVLADMLEDLQAGRLGPAESLEPRVNLMREIAQRERGLIPSVPDAEDAALAAYEQGLAQHQQRLGQIPGREQMLQRMDMDNALLSALVDADRVPRGQLPEGLWDQGLLHGVPRKDQLSGPLGQTERSLSHVPGDGQTQVIQPGETLYRRLQDILQGQGAPESIGPLLAELEARHIPVHGDMLRHSYLGGARDQLNRQLASALMQQMMGGELALSTATDLHESLGSEAFVAMRDRLRRLAPDVPESPAMMDPAYDAAASLGGHTTPILEELMALLRTRAGL